MLQYLSELFDSSKLEDTAIITGYQGQPRKILVIDDHQESRSIMRNFWIPLGFEIVEANDGQEGLNKAYEVHPDLIVTDLVMPVMNGFELVRRLRKIPDFFEIPIIAVSASILENDQSKLSKAGFYNAFLPKPVRAENLLELLRIYLGLNWIYGSYPLVVPVQEPNQASIAAAEQSSELLVGPSKEQLTNLLDFVSTGDLYGILDEVTQLEQADERLVPFATKIRQLAKKYEIDKIEELINQYI